MHTNGNEEKGKEGRQEKEVVPFEASSREPSVPKAFASAKAFVVSAQKSSSHFVRLIHSFHRHMNSCVLDAHSARTYYRRTCFIRVLRALRPHYSCLLNPERRLVRRRNIR